MVLSDVLSNLETLLFRRKAYKLVWLRSYSKSPVEMKVNIVVALFFSHFL